MWPAILIQVAIFWLLVSCAQTITVHTLQRDDIGPAATCTWVHHMPSDCVYDPHRGTINLDYLEELLNQIQQQQEDEFNRRKL